MRRLRAEGEAGCGSEAKEGIGLERFVVGGGWEGRSWIEEGRACVRRGGRKERRETSVIAAAPGQVGRDEDKRTYLSLALTPTVHLPHRTALQPSHLLLLIQQLLFVLLGFTPAPTGLFLSICRSVPDDQWAPIRAHHDRLVPPWTAISLGVCHQRRRWQEGIELEDGGGERGGGCGGGGGGLCR